MIQPYRTKMEYSIYVDNDEILHLAQHIKGTKRGIIPVDNGSEIALPKLNESAKYIINKINEKKLKKSQVKGIMIRYSIYENKSVCYIYVKDEEIDLDAGDFFDPDLMKGAYIYFSTKKSPAFVETALISSIGEKVLIEKLNEKVFKFPSNGFFQINIPIVAEFLKDAYDKLNEIPESNRNLLLDLYAGVGTIGIYMGSLFKKIIGVELFLGSKEYALQNAKENNLNNYDFIENKSEDIQLKTLISNKDIIFLDPPRAGCNPKLIEELLDAGPSYIFYLSCNPETQKRDCIMLEKLYEVVHSKDYNFFPGTEHLERFIILKFRP